MHDTKEVESLEWLRGLDKVISFLDENTKSYLTVRSFLALLAFSCQLLPVGSQLPGVGQVLHGVDAGRHRPGPPSCRSPGITCWPRPPACRSRTRWRRRRPARRDGIVPGHGGCFCRRNSLLGRCCCSRRSISEQAPQARHSQARPIARDPGAIQNVAVGKQARLPAGRAFTPLLLKLCCQKSNSLSRSRLPDTNVDPSSH